MSKGKLAKFADMERFENVFQYPYSVVDDVPFDMKGKWREMSVPGCLDMVSIPFCFK